MDSALTLIILFLLLVLSGSLFVMGIYVITRHEVVQLPDETYQIKGKLLKGWSVFWEKIREDKPVYFSGEKLFLKLILLRKHAPQIALKLKVGEYDTCLEINDNDNKLTAEEKYRIEEVLDCHTFDKEDCLFLYEIYPVYSFFEWIRNPLSACPVCMSSVWGSIFWWGMYGIFNNCYNFNLVFSGWLFLWLPFIISVAFLNKILSDKFKI